MGQPFRKQEWRKAAVFISEDIISRIAELTVFWLALFFGLKFSFVCLAGFVEAPNTLAFRFDDLAVLINSVYCTTLLGCFL